MGVRAGMGLEEELADRMSSHRIALNCSLSAPPSTTSCHTPNTPEILNAIVDISFPSLQSSVSTQRVAPPPPAPVSTCYQPSFPIPPVSPQACHSHIPLQQQQQSPQHASPHPHSQPPPSLLPASSQPPPS